MSLVRYQYGYSLNALVTNEKTGQHKHSRVVADQQIEYTGNTIHYSIFNNIVSIKMTSVFEQKDLQ